MAGEIASRHSVDVDLRCLLVDDSPLFLQAASKLLEGKGIAVVGVASTVAEALEQAEELRPDVALVDVELGGESGFELARRLTDATTPLPAILISTRSEEDLAELVEAGPALGFLSKADLSAHAIRALLYGGVCQHEALVYSTVEEFLATTVRFVREGLDAQEPVLVVTKQANLRVLREALDADVSRVDFVDSAAWYRSPSQTFEAYDGYVRTRLEDGVGRMRIIGEPVWPATPARLVAEWKRYESAINVAWAAKPLSVICPYDAGELPDAIVADAHRTHPVLRTGCRTRPSPHYADPDVFVRELGLDLSEILTG